MRMLSRFGLALFAAAALADTSLEEGLALLSEGRLDAAQRALREAVQQNPDSAPMRNALGVALSRARRWPAAIDEFQQAVRIAPEHAEAYFNLGIALSAQKRHVDAAAAFSSVLGLNPDFTDARTGLVSALEAVAREGDPEAAIGHDEGLLAVEPSSTRLAHLGAELLLHGELHAAQAALEEALRRQPELALAHFLLGRRFELAGDGEAALREYRQGVLLDPRNVEFALRYGAILSRTEPEEGVAVLTKALENAPIGPATDRDDSRAQAHFALGSVWGRLGDRERAQTHFEQARERRAQVHARQQALIHLNQGIAHLNAGKTRDAASALQQSITFAPDLPEALHMLGVANSALNDWPAAERSFRAALKVRPKDAYILLSYARALYDKGRTERALNRLEETLKVDPERTEARCLLAKALRRLGREESASQELERARQFGACSLEDEP